MKNSYISSFNINSKYNVTGGHVVIFFCILMTSFAFLEVTNRYFLATKSTSAKNLKSFRSARNDVRILFLGDSHFRFDIDATKVNDAAYNLSFDGANYIQLYYMLKHYIEKSPSLEMMVLPVDLFSFSSFRTNRIFLPSFWNKFIDYSELQRIKGVKIFKSKYYLSLIQERFGVKDMAIRMWNLVVKKKHEGNELSKVFAKGSESLASDKETALKRVKYHFDGHNIFDKDLALYYKKILELCKKNNILVVTMQVPNSQYYLDFSSKYVTYDDLSKKIIENPKYKNLVYRNLNYLELYKDNNSFFRRDGDHLNNIGRMDFSKHIASDVDKILIRNK